MAHHELKIWPAFFDEIRSGRKSFDIRKNDRGYQKGDSITFREWDPDQPNVADDEKYTGKSFTRTITYVLSGWGLQPEHVALALAPATAPN